MPPLRRFLSKRKRTAARVQQMVDRFDLLHDLAITMLRGDPHLSYQEWIAAYDTLSDADLAAVGELQANLADGPNFLVIVPAPDADDPSLGPLVRSFGAQAYERWEMEVVTGKGGPLADRLNDVLRVATSDFVVLVDPAITLRQHALFLLARTLDRHRDATLVYGDDDVIDESGSRFDHYFKPDWNETLFRCQNYFGGVVAFRRTLALDVGGFGDAIDTDVTWSLFLRMSAAAAPGTIHHVPFVLSHYRTTARPNPSASGDEAAAVLQRELGRIGERVDVEPVGQRSYKTRYAPPDKRPLVSVIVPSTGKLELLRPCLDGLLNRTAYSKVEVLLVANDVSHHAHDRGYLDAVIARPEVRLLQYDERPFNFSRVNNWAARQANGDLLCFLNDDTEVITNDWLSSMVAQVVRDRVAAVGAMLVYPTGRIQHAGVLLGPGGVAAHMYSRRPASERGYHERALLNQDVSCVTAACMLVRRDVFLEVGGFDETLAIAFNDVDLCLRLRKAEWRVVWTPCAQLVHKESSSVGRHNAPERERAWNQEFDLMRSRWANELLSDPCYNPNLSLDPLQLWQPAFPPRVSYPW
jgi:GT2 family glycosyltransferase